MKMEKHSNSNDQHEHHGPEHYIKIWAVLLGLLIVSILGPMVGIRWITLITAFGIAIVKALIVAREFMHLRVERKIVTMILVSMLALTSVFFFGVAPDVMKTEGQNWVKTYNEAKAVAKEIELAKEAHHEGGALESATDQSNEKEEETTKSAVQKPKFAKAWMVTPEMLANGKTVFNSNCVTCHGAEGKGDGAASAGLNPKPRNFTQATNWKQGRKPSNIFHTITAGLGGMPAFASLSSDDRWSVVHYVRSLGPHASEKDSNADLVKIGIDPSQDFAGGGSQEIPIGLAIDQIANEKK